MWEHVDSLLAGSSASLDVMRGHRVELLEARRRRAAGIDLDSGLIADQTRVAVNEMAVPGLLARVRAAYDGPLLLMKGPEVALDYGAPGLRSFGDLDLLTDDAEAAQAALLEAGFQEVFDADIYEDIHHLRPLWWPGLPIVVELHTRAKWPDRDPRAVERGAVRGRRTEPARRRGVTTLPPEHHTLVLAAHAWEHQPLGLPRQSDRRRGRTAAQRPSRGGAAGPPLGLPAHVADDAARFAPSSTARGTRRRSRCGRATCAGCASAPCSSGT